MDMRSEEKSGENQPALTRRCLGMPASRRELVAGIDSSDITSRSTIPRKHSRGTVGMFVPIAIPVLFLIMYLRGSDAAHISRLSRHALLLIPLSLPMFIPLAMAERLGLSFWTALGCGIALAAITITVYLWLGPRAL